MGNNSGVKTLFIILVVLLVGVGGAAALKHYRPDLFTLSSSEVISSEDDESSEEPSLPEDYIERQELYTISYDDFLVNSTLNSTTRTMTATYDESGYYLALAMPTGTFPTEAPADLSMSITVRKNSVYLTTLFPIGVIVETDAEDLVFMGFIQYTGNYSVTLCSYLTFVDVNSFTVFTY